VILELKIIMEALSVQIINPKAMSLLMNLEDMNLIRIKAKPTLSEMLAKIRRNESNVPSLEEITNEVELVRQKRYNAKIQNNN
jgi:hypothetical protein